MFSRQRLRRRQRDSGDQGRQHDAIGKMLQLRRQAAELHRGMIDHEDRRARKSNFGRRVLEGGCLWWRPYRAGSVRVRGFKPDQLSLGCVRESARRGWVMAGGFWLLDQQWAVLAPLMPINRCGAHRKDDRRIISGIVHRLRNGGRWQDDPACCGPPPRCATVITAGRSARSGRAC